mmetsp:Transcript_14718/g.30193  ORF Transcript_14718/g.30193 Transcript_14718/m.30193 type:complete len:224 (-) Transcript_14718:146-817(-)
MAKTAAATTAGAEALIGSRLISGDPKSAPKPTLEVIKGAELVALYFSASWCPPCRSFTPLLVDFYNTVGKENGLRVVFVSSDRDIPSFQEYFKKMPWAAIPFDDAGAKRKGDLAAKMQIQGIPALVVLDAKTGGYITDNARNELMGVGTPQHGKELLEGWKSKVAVPIEEAEFTHGKEPFGLRTIIKLFLQNPVWIFGMMYFFNQFMKWLQELGEEEEGGKDL